MPLKALRSRVSAGALWVWDFFVVLHLLVWLVVFFGGG